jgi:aryl-alcohol dehydrogenase-like predicted oxidoreductase
MLCRACVESDYISLIKENGLRLTIFSLLKIGILTGKYSAGIPPDSRLSQADKDLFIKAQKERYDDEAWKKDLEIVSKLVLWRRSWALVRRIWLMLGCSRTLRSASCQHRAHGSEQAGIGL